MSETELICWVCWVCGKPVDPKWNLRYLDGPVHLEHEAPISLALRRLVMAELRANEHTDALVPPSADTGAGL